MATGHGEHIQQAIERFYTEGSWADEYAWTAPEDLARVAMDAIPDGWAKLGGEWVRLRPVNVRRDAGRRTYEEA